MLLGILATRCADEGGKGLGGEDVLQLEVLCVKAGEGSLAVDGNLLLQKDTKKLPKTD